MHVWPAVIRRPVTACLTAKSRSASASTTNGSEPPSSSTLFLSALPASAATNAPARSEPVSVTAATRGSAISRADTSGTFCGATIRLVNTPAGAPAAVNTSSSASAVPETFGRVLEERRVARHQRRPGEADDLPEREVPRHHGEDDPDRLVADDVAPVARVDGLVGEDAGRGLGEVLARRGALLDLEAGLGERLAHLRHDELRQLLGALAQPGRDRGQQRAALLDRDGGATRGRPRRRQPPRPRSAQGRARDTRRPPARSWDRRR